MEHRKRDHENLTPYCKNVDNGSCDYEVNCWFRHTKEMMHIEENDVNEDNVNNYNNIMQRIFKLMEDMTMRMTRIENMK